MRVYVGFDDTDVAGATRGTGKFARWFVDKIPAGIELFGVIRQQLPVLEGIPYTSQNSSACLILDNVDPSQVDALIELGTAHIQEHFIEGSDPGLCVVPLDGQKTEQLFEFGRIASSRIVSQKDAMRAANGFHLSGHGGTNDGIIGATAGVGLTISGWCGRFIEYGKLREIGNPVTVGELEAAGMHVLSIDRNSLATASDDVVDTQNWLRPRLWSGRAVVPVETTGQGRWRTVGGKNKPAQ